MRKITFMVIIICSMLSMIKMIDLAYAEIGTFYANDQIVVLSEPIFKSTKIIEIDIGTELTAYDKKGSWYYVTTKTGNAGWVSDTWVSDSKPVLNVGAELISHQKESKIKELEAKVKPIPAYKVDENLELYKKLMELDPTNQKYKNKVAHYSAAKKKGGSSNNRLIVGKKYVTTAHPDSVWATDIDGLWGYFYYRENILDELVSEMLSREGVASPVRSGIVALITAVEKKNLLQYGDHTVYTVKPIDSGQYYFTFGKGLKPFP
jgi:hypothetical protein